jgi:anti-anti-sigma factor
MDRRRLGPVVDVVVTGRGATVQVAGDLDIASAPELASATLPLPDREGLEITVDLGAVGFCDSSGIGALVRLRQRCEESGWRFETINAQPAVRQILVDYTGLGPYLNVR